MAHALAAPPLAAPSLPEVVPDLPSVSTWTAVSEGLWSCTREGRFLGSIEFTAGGFEAVDCTGTPLGRSHSLAGAKKLIDGLPPEPYADTLVWNNDRRAFTWTWCALGVSAIASVALAVQLFT